MMGNQAIACLKSWDVSWQNLSCIWLHKASCRVVAASAGCSWFKKLLFQLEKQESQASVALLQGETAALLQEWWGRHLATAVQSLVWAVPGYYCLESRLQV